MEGGVHSWKKFYAERKRRYKTKFPFLANEQIAARLKKMWSRERRKNSSSSELFCPLKATVLPVCDIRFICT